MAIKAKPLAGLEKVKDFKSLSENDHQLIDLEVLAYLGIGISEADVNLVNLVIAFNIPSIQQDEIITHICTIIHRLGSPKYSEVIFQLYEFGLLRRFQTPDKRQTLLHLSSFHGAFEVAEKIVEYEVDLVNFKDANDRTPLMFASMKGSLKIVQLLLNAGAEVWCVDDNLQNSLRFARMNSSSREIIELLKSQPRPRRSLTFHLTFFRKWLQLKTRRKSR